MRKSVLFAAMACVSLVSVAPLTAATKPPPRKVVDLADVVAGTYSGDIISDSRGSSQSGVTITVTKAGPNTISVASSERLPTFTVKLTRAMRTIQQARGDNVFLVDQAKSPWSLDVTVDGASWSGTKD